MKLIYTHVSIIIVPYLVLWSELHMVKFLELWYLVYNAEPIIT